MVVLQMVPHLRLGASHVGTPSTPTNLMPLHAIAMTAFAPRVLETGVSTFALYPDTFADQVGHISCYGSDSIKYWRKAICLRQLFCSTLLQRGLQYERYESHYRMSVGELTVLNHGRWF